MSEETRLLFLNTKQDSRQVLQVGRRDRTKSKFSVQKGVGTLQEHHEDSPGEGTCGQVRDRPKKRKENVVLFHQIMPVPIIHQAAVHQ